MKYVSLFHLFVISFFFVCVCCLLWTLGALDEALHVFRDQNISLSRIESRPSTSAEYDYDFYVDFFGMYF